jgi:hypothetical protein
VGQLRRYIPALANERVQCNEAGQGREPLRQRADVVGLQQHFDLRHAVGFECMPVAGAPRAELRVEVVAQHADQRPNRRCYAHQRCAVALL